MIALCGLNFKKESQYSHASKIKKSFAPVLKLLSIEDNIPPIDIVGSFFSFQNISDTKEDVVVLPWVPAMHIGYL